MEEKQSNIYKTLFLGLFIIILLAGVGLGGYFFGQSQKDQKIFPSSSMSPTARAEISPTVTILPSPTVIVAEDKNLVTIGVDTVSFGRKGEEMVLRYRDKIYDESNQFAMEGKKISDVSSYQWYGLVDAPAGVPAGEFMLDEVFGFKIAPDKKKFLFIMRWGTEGEKITDSYYLYYYDPYESVNKLVLLQKFSPSVDEGYSIPKLNQFSQDGKYISLDMYGCWNCGGHKPETLLMNLETRKTSRIGKVSYFTWRENGSYGYKDYKVIPCEGESMGECSEKPENLPLKTGTFQ